jgi:opacity protein-like surface antigen
MARDDSWYVGVGLGVMLVEDMLLDIRNVSDAGTLNYDTGYDAEGVVGYDFGGFRAEVEVGYRSAAAESIAVTAPGIPSSANGTGTFTGTRPTNGDVNVLSFMLNGLLDFGDDDGLQGFVGGGVGVARTDVSSVFAGPWLNDSDTGFAWQAIAGVRAPLSNSWDVGLKYRFFNADNVGLIDQRGFDVDSRFRSHSLLGTLTYNFGGPAAPAPAAPMPMAPPPPPAPPAPPPPPPPAPVVCAPGPYIVYFDWDQSAITPEAASTLDNAVSAYNSGCSGTKVMLAGHADRSGRPGYNVGLSQRRNEAVQGYMSSRGVSNFAAEAFGESRPAVATADGVRNDQNRRVEITYGPGSGM